MRVAAAVALGVLVVGGGVPTDALAKKPKSTMSAKLDGKGFKTKAVVVTRIGTSFGVTGAPIPKRLGGLIRTIALLCEVDLPTLVTPATLTQTNSQCGGEYRESHLGDLVAKRWPSSALSVTIKSISGRVVKGEFEGTFDPDKTHPLDRSHAVTKGKFTAILKAPVS